jgi:hypothetical protein
MGVAKEADVNAVVEVTSADLVNPDKIFFIVPFE